jgi:hypothetical protein
MTKFTLSYWVVAAVGVALEARFADSSGFTFFVDFFRFHGSSVSSGVRSVSGKAGGVKVMKELWVIEYREGTGPWQFYEAWDLERLADAHLAGIHSHIHEYRKRRFVPALEDASVQ